MLRDFPSDSYYRLFDIVQLLYKSETSYYEEENTGNIEVIVAKGMSNVPYSFKIQKI